MGSQRRRSSVTEGDKRGKDGKVSDGALVDDEERQQGAVSLKIYGVFARAMGSKIVTGLITLFACAEIARVSNDFWLAQWSSATVNENLTDDETEFFLGIYTLIGMCGILCVLGRALLAAEARINAARSLHSQVYEVVTKGTMTFFDTNPTGRIMNRFSKDMDIVDLNLMPAVQQVVSSGFVVIATLIGISVSSSGAFLIMLMPVLYAYYKVQGFYRKSSIELQRLDAVTRSPIFASFQETLAGAMIVRAFGATQRFFKENEDRINTNAHAFIQYQTGASWLSLRLDLIGAFVVFFVALISVAWDGLVSPALAALGLAYAFEFTSFLKHASRMMAELESKMNSVERIHYYIENVPCEAQSIVEDNRPAAQWPSQGAIEFEDFSLRYRDDMPLVLSKLFVSIKPNEKVGICGRTGAGKSSLMTALFRIVEPASGRLVIDGVDVTKIGLEDLRSKLFIIPQDPLLFSGTVRYNLDPFHEATDERLWEVLNVVQLQNSFGEEGLDSDVKSGGSNFSVGERQLICIARALLKNAKILVLDEATASVDVETDAIIQKGIREHFQDCTVLTIAHRLNTIMDSDRIMVLDKGRVVEFDAPQTLLKNPEGVFYSLVHG
eukprot:GFYU01002778.1.p1 GENE.GFYU01002778.1~~GFYU01002778.1.p1  ORF type:complete len:610 (-),score=232.05 GFYU01002778.1:74-1903(-)